MEQNSLSNFEAILSVHEKPIFNYVYRLVQRKEVAEDIVQETFIRVYSNMDKIKKDGNLKAWIYKIATNLVYDWLRKKRRVKEISIVGEDYDGFGISENQLPHASMKDIGKSNDILSAVQRLKPNYQTVILLFYYQDFNYKEISDILSIPINTVKTNLSRAKQCLKISLESYDNFNSKKIIKKQHGLSF
jgi:RNA polymerase sigma-70 factor (ECF subfamily)